MKIFVDGREAALKQNFSFDYMVENNLAIFGNLKRLDVSKEFDV